MAGKESKTSSSIRLSKDDKSRLKWLRKHYGGLGQSAVVTMALKELYTRQYAFSKLGRDIDRPTRIDEMFTKLSTQEMPK